MALTFLNGGGPDYLGVPVANGSAILTQIRNTLVSAGWTLVTDGILTGNTLNQSVTLICTAIGSSHQAWYRFSIADGSANLSGGLELRIQGSSNAGFTTTSKQFYLQYVSFNTDSRIWITADEDSFAITLISFANVAGCVFGGFLNRLELTDGGAYCIGYPLSDITIRYPDNASSTNALTRQFYQIGLSGFNSAAWKEVLDDFSIGANPYTNGVLMPMQGFFDRYTTVFIANTLGFPSGVVENRSPAINAYNGSLNAVTNKAVLGEYFVTEGRGSKTNYGAGGALSNVFYYRGPVKNIVIGLASLPAGAQVVDVGGRRFISSGGVGWQGQRIL